MAQTTAPTSETRKNGSTRGSWKKWRRVTDQSRFEQQLDPGFTQEITSIPNGERLHECIQCGTCSAACAVSAFMDYTPRRLIAMTRAGCRDDVLHSLSPWVCTSCYACTVECPKQVPVTEIMHALKRTALREGEYPRRFTTPIMAREFVGMIERHGRSTESWISLKLYLKTNPFQLLKYYRLALRLARLGRLGFGRESIRRPAELRRMLEAVETPASRVPARGTSTGSVGSLAVAATGGGS
ncbi:MAG: 4Fe-4S dicluster domain-containing protein [Actinomycetota bacterium]